MDLYPRPYRGCTLDNADTEQKLSLEMDSRSGLVREHAALQGQLAALQVG